LLFQTTVDHRARARNQVLIEPAAPELRMYNPQLLQLEPVLRDPLAASAEKEKPTKVERVKVRKAKNLHLPHLSNP